MTDRDRSSFSASEIDLLISVLNDRFGLAMGSDSERARSKTSLLLREMAKDMGEDQTTIFSSILEGRDRSFVDILTSHITVGETYFFRDREALASLRKTILPQLGSDTGRPAKIWSAGCSTGEEPYSLAMILDNSMLALSRGFRIYGTDLNENSLKKAREALYRRWSFRGMDEAEITRYFDPVDKDYHEVKARYRSTVSFDLLNLAAPWGLPWIDGKVDVILCRNVMMYFDDETRKRVLKAFHDALSPGGWLIVATCETSLVADSPFLPTQVDKQMFFRSQGGSSKISIAKLPETWDFYDALNPASWEGESPFLEKDTIEELQEEPVEPDESLFEDLSASIKDLADRGMFDQALALCTSQGNSTTPYVHYISSMIYQGKGDIIMARKSLRSALFLDPSFIMAHYGLLGLSLSEGDVAEATRHRRNLKELLSSMDHDDPIPHGDGATARDMMSFLSEGKEGG